MSRAAGSRPRDGPAAWPPRDPPPAASSSPEAQLRVGQLLVARGLISVDQLKDALAAKEPDERLGETLVRRRTVFENDLARTLASQCGLEYVDLNVSDVKGGCARLLP